MDSDDSVMSSYRNCTLIGAAESSGETTRLPLLRSDDDVVVGSVDCQGRPVYRSNSGGWKSASFIIFVELAERFAYYGITSNLINYLTGQLSQSTATAAENVNVWSGTAALLPLLGAFIADSFLGRYRTIIFASSLYILGLAFLTVLAVTDSSDCKRSAIGNSSVCSTSELRVIFFFFSLYLVAAAQGGHKPCVQAFGADQFDTRDPVEFKAKSSFFNWWYFGMCGGNVVTISTLNYVQDNFGWGLGFGIPCIAMALSLAIFLLGTKTYRFGCENSEKSQLTRVIFVFFKAIRNNWKSTSQPQPAAALYVEETLPHQSSQQFKFLDKALIAPDGSKEDGEVSSSISDIESAKSILRLIPILTTCLVFAIVFAQVFTFFTKQGVTMDRLLPIGFEVPAAALQSLMSISILIFIPIYDRILVPLARRITGKQCGITTLQRIGTGLILSVLCMATAAVVERKRLETAREYGPEKETVPMSVGWLIPQYMIFGIAEAHAMVGLQELFYDQVPSGLKSTGLSLYLSIFGIGNFLSSFLISVIQKVTATGEEDGWFCNNLNRAHLDYFYWLLVGLSAVAFLAYLYFAKSFIYMRGTVL